MAITITDTPPLGEETVVTVVPDATPYEYSCEVCGVELFYGGRGRKPRFCDEHKKNKPSTSQTRKAASPSIDALVTQIQDLHRMIGTGLMFYPPTSMDGMVLIDGADKLGASWKTLLERDPKVRKMWEKFFTVSGYGAVIGTYAFSLAMPIMQNHNIIPKAVVPEQPSYTPSTPFSTTQFDEMGES